MKDCHKDITGFHQDEVRLKLTQKTTLKKRRDANRNRLKKGLVDNEDPEPDEFVRQGSDAHGTTIKEPSNAYDIDDGAVFLKEDLKGTKGGDKLALDAKKMVRSAVDDGSFNTPPEVKTNCVRVHYDDGSHVDIPVYRKFDNGEFEIASADWKKSDPKGVNNWFQDCLGRRCDDGRSQMCDLIRMLKAYCKIRSSYSLPSGFALSVLVDEKYVDYDSRLDRAFRNLITAIKGRLDHDLSVQHPVIDEKLADSDDSKCKKMRELLATSISDLAALDQGNCKRSKALKIWKKVFNNTDYFDVAIEEAEKEEKKSAAACVAAVAVMPKPYASNIE